MRRPALTIWFAAYVILVAIGVRVGLQIIVLPTLLLLFIPPFFGCMRATYKIANRTKDAFPNQWGALNRDWTKLELRYYYFDDQTFGDETIAFWKRELRWWLRIVIFAMVIFLPTLFLIEKISK